MSNINHHNEYDVLIIGAGVAGLSAALELLDQADAQKQKRPSILILEADSKIGGRVQTIMHEGRSINTGAHWFHGGTSNSFYQFVKNRYPQFSFHMDDTKTESPVYIVTSKGEKRRNLFYKRMVKLFRAAWVALEKNHDYKITLQDLADSIKTKGAHVFADMIASATLGALPNEVSAYAVTSSDIDDGGMQCDQGNGAIINTMAKELKNKGVTIKISSPVASVSEEDDFVIVTDQNGKNYKTSKVICTASIGTLDAKEILFSPHSSNEHIDAVAGLEMITMNKIVIPVRDDFFAANNIQPNTHIYFTTTDPTTDPTIYCNVYPNGTPVVAILVTDALAIELEEWPAHEVENFAKNVLKQSTLLKGFENYIDGEILTTRWCQTPYISGSYTVARPGNKWPEAGFTLGQHVLFAGEGWCSVEEGAAQMAGAHFSGKKAAQMVWAQLAKPQAVPQIAITTQMPNKLTGGHLAI